jgi:hypothetical protein
MIPLFIALTSCQQGSVPAPNGASQIGKMFAYYAKATSLTGTIKMKQSAQNMYVTLDGDVAYESPSKLYIKQVLSSKNPSTWLTHPRTWLVTSDGQEFTYDFPNEVQDASSKPETHRMHEMVVGVNGPQTYQDIFHVVIRSLGDVSIPELAAIGGTANFRTIRSEIATIDSATNTLLGDSSVVLVKGDWRSSEHAEPSGKYAMWITPEGQLKRYEQDEIISLDPKMKPQEVVTTWDVDLKVNAVPDETLFKVVLTPIG